MRKRRRFSVEFKAQVALGGHGTPPSDGNNATLSRCPQIPGRVTCRRSNPGTAIGLPWARE